MKKIQFLILILTLFHATASLALAQEPPPITIVQARALPVYDTLLLPPDSSSETHPIPHFDVVDFNRDGRLDLVIGETAGLPFQPEPPFVAAVYLQTGQGTFERQPNPHPVPVGNRLRGLFMRDFNRDGHLDLLTTDHLVDLILLPGKADGSFAEPAWFGIPSTFPTVADLNKDSIPDVVVATADGGVSVLLSTGDGGLHLSQALDTISAPERGAGQSLIGDVNGDGNPDVVVLSVQNFASSTGNLDVFLGKGDGTFHDVIRNGRVATWRGTLADFNNDGKLDFAGTRGAPLAIEIWLGQGDGRFEAFRTYPTANNNDPQFLVPGDLNGDGIVDLVVSQVTTQPRPSTLGILLGRGDGTWQPWKQYVPFQGYVAADVEPRIVDLNGDGRLDIITHALRSADFARSFAVSMAQDPKPDPGAYLLTTRNVTNKAVTLETSTDLNTWTPVATNTPTGIWPVVHSPGAAPQSFYRVHSE